ncbi:MAG: hypothetical protein M1834_007746 [Cirrosporium novae-zelandiae]|nr:MAG: hypothetical protein M1834_007746 [Cirrosporium novae-zelandiae]
MAATSTTVIEKVTEGSPYQLSPDQTLKAAEALLAHIKSEAQKRESESSKKTLLPADSSSEDGDSVDGEDPIWLILTTKRHILDKTRLKPSKIKLPHSYNTSPTSTICLITTDPQRAVKDVISDPTFPPELASRITRVVGLQKIRTKYKSFESRRSLRDEHDIFLADDRIITRLPHFLGKIFYKTSKKPFPVALASLDRDSDGKRIKREKNPQKAEPRGLKTPAQIAKEIETTLGTAAVFLSPSVTTAVKVGHAKFSPKQLEENVAAVVNEMVGRFVPKKWRNVKSIHIKGANTMALPIWLAEELWLDGKQIMEAKEEEDQQKALEGATAAGDEVKAITAAGEDTTKEETPKKRKASGEVEKAVKKTKKSKKDDGEAKEAAARKERLRKQKTAARKALDE